MVKAKSKKPIHPHWRPNFRIEEALPDIKAVRTEFLLNFIAVTIAAVLFVYLGYREYTAHTLASRAATLEEQVATLEPTDRRNVRLSSQFVRESKKTQEVLDFLAQPFDPAQFLITLAQIQPEEGLLTSFRFYEGVVTEGRNSRLVYWMSVNGTMGSNGSAPATQLIDTLLDRLRNHQALQGSLARIDLESAMRDPKTDRFQYSILIELNPPLLKQGK